jgi:hypothetical protein
VSAAYRGPLVDDARPRARLVAVVREAARRVGATTVLAWIALIALSMAWDRLHFIGPIGDWPPAENFPDEFWWSVLVVEMTLATLLVAAVLVADVVVDRGGRAGVAYAVAIVAASAIGAWLQIEARRAFGLRLMVDMPGVPRDVAMALPLYVFFDSIVRTGMFVAVYANRRTTLHAQARMRAAELARAHARRRTFESRLQALQARVEPQFLFNTLAHVRSLYGVDARLASGMLDDLIGYLRAALPHLRESTSTLGKEMALAEAYVRILRARGGLHTTIAFDVPHGLRDAALPAMVLLPLIDAAAGHAARQGALHVESAAQDGLLRIAIRGEAAAASIATSDAGAWRAIEERLHELYGDRAGLRVEARPEGARAVIEIPHERASASPDRRVAA